MKKLTKKQKQKNLVNASRRMIRYLNEEFGYIFPTDQIWDEVERLNEAVKEVARTIDRTS